MVVIQVEMEPEEHQFGDFMVLPRGVRIRLVKSGDDCLQRESGQTYTLKESGYGKLCGIQKGNPPVLLRNGTALYRVVSVRESGTEALIKVSGCETYAPQPPVELKDGVYEIISGVSENNHPNHENGMSVLDLTGDQDTGVGEDGAPFIRLPEGTDIEWPIDTCGIPLACITVKQGSGEGCPKWMVEKVVEEGDRQVLVLSRHGMPRVGQFNFEFVHPAELTRGILIPSKYLKSTNGLSAIRLTASCGLAHGVILHEYTTAKPEKLLNEMGEHNGAMVMAMFTPSQVVSNTVFVDPKSNADFLVCLQEPCKSFSLRFELQ